MRTVGSVFVCVCIAFGLAAQAQTPATLLVRVQSDISPWSELW